MKLRWGILSTARIATEKVIPAIQNAPNCVVEAIASRDGQKAEAAASALGIRKAYASYEALLADGDIDVVYNPLPNHLHVPFTLKALEAGKHVLCEKPIAMNAAEAILLVEECRRYPHLKVMEAFMYRFHPQWIKTKELVEQGAVGEVKAIQSFFSYFNINPNDIRNQAGIGGGALMDIGCYCIQFPRFIMGKEPQRVVAQIDVDPNKKIDRITNALLDFGDGCSSVFTCATQLHPSQRVQIIGTKGRIEIEVPVNGNPERLLKVSLFSHEMSTEMFIGPADQYTLQAEAFANSVINNTPVPIPLSDAVANMKVIDAVFESAKEARWIKL